MYEKVFYTSVLVSDPDKALDFYTNVLGLEFPWGYVAQFQDPDGNRLQLREAR